MVPILRSPTLWEGRPLSQDFTTLESLHAIRQHYQRLPLAPYKHSVPISSDVAHCVTRLQEDGFIKLSDFLKPGELIRLRSDFACFMRNLKFKRLFGCASYRHYDDEEYWSRHDRIFVTNMRSSIPPRCCGFVVIRSSWRSRTTI